MWDLFLKENKCEYSFRLYRKQHDVFILVTNLSTWSFAIKSWPSGSKHCTIFNLLVLIDRLDMGLEVGSFIGSVMKSFFRAGLGVNLEDGDRVSHFLS